MPHCCAIVGCPCVAERGFISQHFKRRQKAAQFAYSHAPHAYRDDGGQRPKMGVRDKDVFLFCIPGLGSYSSNVSNIDVFYSFVFDFIIKRHRDLGFALLTTLFFFSLITLLAFPHTYTLVTPRIPDYPCTMTPISSRRIRICLSVIIIGLCSLSSPNVGHVHGLTIPLDHRSFPAIAHAPHSRYPHSNPHPAVSHIRFEKLVVKLTSTSEDDILRELFTLALQGNEQGSHRHTLFPSEDQVPILFFFHLKNETPSKFR